MARRTLRVELGVLERSFPRGGSPVEVLSANTEEVTIRFVHPSSWKVTLQCNLPVSKVY